MKKALVILAMGSVSAFATTPWVECGIGGAVSTLFPNKQAANIVAVASNIIWDLGTTATSSAVSSPDLCMNKSTAAAKLIQDTYETLVAETAKGEGKNLTALLDIVEVPEANRSAFIEGLRSEMGVSMKASGFAAKTQVEKAQSYYYGMVRIIEKQS
jgi:hypothetical protein